MTDFDAAACGGAERGLERLGVEARQLVLDRAQRFEHLAGQKILGAPLRFLDRQHARGTEPKGMPFPALTLPSPSGWAPPSPAVRERAINALMRRRGSRRALLRCRQTARRR